MAIDKPVFLSSIGDSEDDEPSAATDGDPNTHVFTIDLPWSFVAVDLEDTYEISYISLSTESDLRTSLCNIFFLFFNTREWYENNLI